MNSGLPAVLLDASQTYVYGIGLISQTDGSGNQRYFLHDGLDSIREMTDGNGAGLADYYYDAFGAYRGSSYWYTPGPEYGFNSQQDDATLGYAFLRATNLNSRLMPLTLMPQPTRPQLLPARRGRSGDPRECSFHLSGWLD